MKPTPREKRIAKELGVTFAGMTFLAKMVARGTAPQRGNEAGRLEKAGFIQHRGGGTCNFESLPFQITEAGRDLVRRAREMGW